MKNVLLAPELRELIAANDMEMIREFCADLHPADLAEYLEPLAPDETWVILTNLPPATRADIFSRFNLDQQVELSLHLRRSELARLVTDMPPDDRVDFIRLLPDETRELLLPGLAQAEREDLKRLLAYPEGTAGSVMTTEYAAVSAGITVAAALDLLRREGPDKETIYYVYVLDSDRRLTGAVSLKDLILAAPETPVERLMQREVISVAAGDDREHAARTIQKYDLLALPVTDAAGALVGIITHDDALDIITQEHTEDLEKFMAITGEHEVGVYMSSSPWQHFRKRVPWLVALAALGLVSGMIVHHFSATLMQFIILALYMPMLTDTGGNTGSQSATMVIRALALREIGPVDAWRVLYKEVRVGLLMAMVLGGLTLARVMFLTHQALVPAGYSLLRIGLAIALALGCQVVAATLVGSLLPLCAARFKLDPAVVASPALTTLVDITGLFIFFTIARVMLGV